jgi:hypothetical protein
MLDGSELAAKIRIAIHRQQMAQWVGQIAGLLPAAYDAVWRQMLAGSCFRVDETPVRVLDPDVEGKKARTSR